MHTASGLGNGGFGREPAGEFGKRQFRAVAGGRRQDLPGGVLVVVGVHDFLEGHDMRRGQGGDVLFADPPGFIDPDVEVLGGVHAGKGLMYGNGGLPAVPDGPAVAYPSQCWHCGCCRIACPTGSIAYRFPMTMML